MHYVTFAGIVRSAVVLSPPSTLRFHCLFPRSTLHTSARLAASLTAPAVNYYKRLGVESTATTEELKAAYRRCALVCHPDVVDDSQKARAEAEFRAVSEAYDVLMDPPRRAEHDKALGLDRAATPMRPSQEREAAGPSSSSSRAAASTRRRKPFVRGDADRKFREAFHGMSLDQVIFQERLRQRQMRREQREATATSSPAGHEESLRRAMADAAERYAEKMRRQYGPGMLRHVKVRTGVSTGPQPPPSDYMPFRPFHGWSVPNGVRTPPEPKMGHTSHVNEERVEFGGPLSPARRHLPKHFPVVRTLGGSVMEKSEAARYLERERNAPYNMGKLYSYHRPY